MPIFNIFKNKKEKNTLSKPKPLIIADIHEKNSLVLASLSENKDIELNITSLKVGDYLIGDTIIERKTFQDFASSMISKRLIQQIENLLQYEKRLIILEGNLKDAIINENALKGMILSISLDRNIPIIQTKNEEDTANYLILLAKQQLKPRVETTFHSRKPDSPEKQKQYILESFPNIGPKNARVLIKKFGSVKKVINASKEELEKEIGKKAESILNLRD